MSETDQISVEEAICRVIADGGVAEFVDVANEVQRRFHLDVTSPQVEQVYHELAKKKDQSERPSARIDLQMTSHLPSEAAPSSSASESHTAEPKLDELGQTLKFVKSVGGLANAKRLLAELESSMQG